MAEIDSEERKRIKTAYHEAAHAVLAIHLGLHVERIDPRLVGTERQSLDGACHFVEPFDTWSDDQFVSVGLAGIAAEEKLYGEKGWRWHKVLAREGGAGDIEAIDARIRHRADRDSFRDAKWDYAQAVLNAEWPAVKALASVLVQSESVQGQTVHEIVHSNM